MSDLAGIAANSHLVDAVIAQSIARDAVESCRAQQPILRWPHGDSRPERGDWEDRRPVATGLPELMTDAEGGVEKQASLSLPIQKLR